MDEEYIMVNFALYPYPLSPFSAAPAPNLPSKNNFKNHIIEIHKTQHHVMFCVMFIVSSTEQGVTR